MKQLHELRAQLQEHITDPVIRGVHLYPSGYSPPNILILKRKTVRSFNSSERVALYYSEKLQRYFSVPFTVGREEEQDDVVGVSEANRLIKPEDEFLKRGGLEKDLDKNQPKKHAVGDEVRYRLGSERHLRVGKVQQVMPEHLIVKRDGSHYKVHKDTVVHNSRTGYTHEELNEIAIQTAKKAYHARQNRGVDVVGVSESAKEDAAIKALIDKPARTEEEQKEYEHQKDLARFRQRNARSSRGGASAGLQRSQHSRGHLNEDNTIIKPEELFHQPKNSKYRVGDKVSYTMASGNQHKRGKIVQVGVNHVVVHRKEPGGGKYGYHYRVPHDAIVHHERMGESVELNEISIPVAKKAYHTRQNRGVDAMNKGDYKTALPQFHKALKTQRLLSKKYERDDKGETVKEGASITPHSFLDTMIRAAMSHATKKPGAVLKKGGKVVTPEVLKTPYQKTQEAVIQEDAISHLKKVVAFKTSTPLYHKDGTQTKIDPQTANALLTVHNSMNPENQRKFADHLEHSKPKLAKMLDFAWKQIK